MNVRFLYKCRKCGEVFRSTSGVGGDGMSHLLDATSGNPIKEFGDRIDPIALHHGCGTGLGVGDIAGTWEDDTE